MTKHQVEQEATKTLSEDDVLKHLEVAISETAKKDLEKVLDESPKKKTKRKAVKKKTKRIKKRTVLGGLFWAKKTKKKELKQEKEETTVKVKSPYKQAKLGPINKFIKRTSSNCREYGRHAANITLSMLMVSMVALTTYVAYAYVANSSNDVIAEVGKHIILPTGETPKVYIIQSEKSEIFKNPLFKGIKVGDNVLTYSSSGKVIIYRSSEDKIVNVVTTGE